MYVPFGVDKSLLLASDSTCNLQSRISSPFITNPFLVNGDFICFSLILFVKGFLQVKINLLYTGALCLLLNLCSTHQVYVSLSLLPRYVCLGLSAVFPLCLPITLGSSRSKTLYISGSKQTPSLAMASTQIFVKLPFLDSGATSAVPQVQSS